MMKFTSELYRNVLQRTRPYWPYANTNLGAGMIIALGTYLSTRAFREDELQTTNKKLEAVEKELALREQQLHQANQDIYRLLDTKADVTHQLSECKTQAAFWRYAHENSWCILRQNYSNMQDNVRINPSRVDEHPADGGPKP